MTRALLALLALGLFGCATTHTAPRFERPSTQPIAKAHKKAISHVQSAQDNLHQLEQSHQELKLQIAAINVDLDNALLELNTSEGARKQLDEQLTQQTTKANELATAYDKSSLQITSLKASRHRWVKYALYAAGLALLEGLWICRTPILMLIASGGL